MLAWGMIMIANLFQSYFVGMLTIAFFAFLYRLARYPLIVRRYERAHDFEYPRLIGPFSKWGLIAYLISIFVVPSWRFVNNLAIILGASLELAQNISMCHAALWLIGPMVLENMLDRREAEEMEQRPKRWDLPRNP